MPEQPKKKTEQKLTLKALDKRLRALERRLSHTERQAAHAYIHTMRIGGPQ